MITQDQLNLRSLGRLILLNEDITKELQNYVYDPIFNTIDYYINCNEETIINEIANAINNMTKGKPIELTNYLYPAQKSLITEILGIPQDKIKIFLEISLTKIHKLIFSNGNIRREIGDLLLHVQYVTPKTVFGLTNIFQIKKLISHKLQNIDIDQLKIIYEYNKSTNLTYGKNGCQITHPQKICKYGEFAHYWFIPNYVYRGESDVLLRAIRAYRYGIPLYIIRDIFWFILRLDDVLLLTNNYDYIVELSRRYINTSFMNAYHLYQLYKQVNRSKNLHNYKSLLQIGGKKISDCIFLFHGLNDEFIKELIQCYNKLKQNNKKRAMINNFEASGLLLLITLRFGGERNPNEISLPT